MKLLLAFVGLVVLASQGTEAARATLEELKAFEKFSPYPWTQWLKLHPGSAAAIAIAPGPLSIPDTDDEDDEEDDSEEATTDDDLQTWFKRATLPEVFDTLVDSDKDNSSDDEDNPIVQVDATKTKAKADKAAAKAEKDKAKLAKKLEKAAASVLGITTTKKPSILDIEPDFWEPPPSIAPNVTVLPPPGYWASKKALFISKLFAALAETVLNSTGPPEPVEITTTTPSPRQALLEELSNVLLSDTVRSLPAPVDDSDETEEASEDVDSDEIPVVVQVTPAPVATLSPYLTQKLDFLGKLSSAIAARPSTPKPTKAPSPWAWGKPTKPTKAPKKAKAKKLKGKKGEVAPAPAAALDYDALAKALLANGAAPTGAGTKAKKF